MAASALIAAADVTAAQRSPSEVTLSGTQLMVMVPAGTGKGTEAKPFVIHGVTWSPATRAPDSGPNPDNPALEVQYGFFFDWPDRNPQGHVVFGEWMRREHKKYYKADIPLMREMGVNTVRLYTDFGLDGVVYKEILDELYGSGIMVIMSVASSKSEIEAARHKKIVNLCKEHPAILMWSIGNEWNLDYSRLFGYRSVADAAQAVEKAARDIKKLDSRHPVSSTLGDRFQDRDSSNTIKHILGVCVSVDIWGLNVYRGKSFGSLFSQWRSISDKPMYLSEFGIDSFRTDSYRKMDGIRASDCVGSIDEEAQADYAIALWREIEVNLSIADPDDICLGGTIHTFNDTPWKVGSYHALLGGLIDYYDPSESGSYRDYNAEGIYLIGGAPDDVFNEEYFGIVDADRRPKEAYRRLRDFYGSLKRLFEKSTGGAEV